MTSGTWQARFFFCFCFLGLGSIRMFHFDFLLLFSGSDKANTYTTIALFKTFGLHFFFFNRMPKTNCTVTWTTIRTNHSLQWHTVMNLSIQTGLPFVKLFRLFFRNATLCLVCNWQLSSRLHFSSLKISFFKECQTSMKHHNSF